MEFFSCSTTEDLQITQRLDSTKKVGFRNFEFLTPGVRIAPIVIIHTASIVSTLSYTIDIRIPQHHGKTTFVLQAILKLTEIKMILLYSRSSSKIIQDTNSFLLNKPNFGLLQHQLTLFWLKFGINSLTIYTEYFTHVVLKCYSDV